MKKILLFLSLLLMSIGVWGTSETITLSDFGWSNASVQSSISSSVSTIALAKNSASTAPTYYTSDGLRIYGVKNGATTGGTISFTPKTGITISKIEFTHTSSNSGSFAIKSGTGSYTNKTWTGTLTAGNTVVLVSKNNTDKNPQVKITQIVITYTSSVPSYTITAVSNNNSYGTVSLSGSVITGSPNSGYRYASPAYTVTIGTATVSQSGNAFNVTPSSNCTVQINFETIPHSLYTVTYNSNGGSVSPSSWTQTSSGQSTTLPTPTRDEYTFNGWYTASSGGTKVGSAGVSFTPTSDTTLYAQWTEIVDCNGDYYNFSLIDGFSSWGTGYSTRKVIYTNDSVVFTSANRQTTTITDIPVTKGQDIIVKSIDGKKISSISLTCRQWESKPQTITLYYSTDRGSTFTSTGMSSTNFKLSYDGFNSNTNAIKISFSSASNQIGIESLCIEHEVCTKTVPVRKGPETNGAFSIDKTEICADSPGGTVTITDIIPADGYVFDTIICVTAKEPFTQLGTVNLSEKKVTGITDSCYITVIFKEQANINIVEWNPDWLKIDVENFTAATATLEDQNTQADVKKNFADSLFFSKYFEAAANVKLLAVYNGTNHAVDISSYGISVATCGENKLPGSFKTTLFSDFIYRDVNNYDNTLSLTSEEMELEPNEEIIFISYQKGKDADSAIIKCAKENEKSGFSQYYRLKTPELQFNGDDAIALVNPDGNFIDLIGAGTKGGGSVVSAVDRTSTTTGTYNGFMDNPGGWYSADGINIETNDSSYALSTNRCLLIRKNRVKSGLNAVARNTTDFVTLGGIYGEWRGLQIPGSTDGGTGDGVSNACSGFDNIGSFDYNEYYIDYDTIYTEDKFIADTTDGYYKIEIPNLDALSCTNLKITVKDESSNELEKIVKIPIMIKTNTTTDDDDYFDKKDCDKCDVVVLKDKTLTVAGTTSANRDIKLYEGAELRVPTSTSYTINSLAFRRYNDTVSSLKLDGTLTVNKVYFDLYITPGDWHYISLPDTFIVSNVKYANGKSPRYGTDCLSRYYDGEYRSRHYKGGWKSVPAGMKFNPGNGFIFGLSGAFKKKEFRFELNPNVITYEKTNKNVIDLHAWGVTTEGLRPNHIGWNLIGNPFMGHFEAEIYNEIRVDSLVKVIENGHWTGQWELSNTTRGKSLRYAVIPSKAPEDKAAGGYKSVVLDDMKLLPFTCFFVQLGDNGNGEGAQGIEFKSSRIINRIVARDYQEEEYDELFLRVKVGDWKTGMFISNKFSEEYEPGDDLESRYPIYQSLGGYKLLYSAINDSIIESGVTITAPQGRLYLDPKVDVDKFEYIYVNYNNNWYDLMRGEVIDIEAGTFILSAKRKVKDNTATDIDYIPTNGLYKFTDGKNIYINKNNTIFNVLGNKLR